jgi:glucose/arabinose dehydrogenase
VLNRDHCVAGFVIVSLLVIHSELLRADPGYVVQRIATGLNQPTAVVQAPNDNTDLYIVQRLQRAGISTTSGGIIEYNPTTQTSTTFLNLSSGLQNVQDGGILSLAFSPNYATNGLFYVASLVGNGSTTCRVDEYEDNGGVITLNRNILTYANLAPTHSVDWLGFQPGGNPNYLYITTGDGGVEANVTGFQNYSQNLNSEYGKLLRVDVSGADAFPSDPDKNFAIPADNPYVSASGALPEIYASGLRNPFRAGFDRQTGDLYIGDVGFNHEEEVDIFQHGNKSGPDYGWAKREGTIQTPDAVSGIGGPQGSSINPIYQYAHSGISKDITGGFVYRGPISQLDGQYLFADYETNQIFSMSGFDPSSDPATFNGANGTVTDITSTVNSLIAGAPSGTTIHRITSFGEDNAGNLYIVAFTNSNSGGNNPALGTGELYELLAVPEPATIALIASGIGLLLIIRFRTARHLSEP